MSELREPNFAPISRKSEQTPEEVIEAWKRENNWSEECQNTGASYSNNNRVDKYMKLARSNGGKSRARQLRQV